MKIIVMQEFVLSLRPNQKYPVVNDILSWLQVYSCYIAILLAAEKTSREEAAGL